VIRLNDVHGSSNNSESKDTVSTSKRIWHKSFVIDLLQLQEEQA